MKRIAVVMLAAFTLSMTTPVLAKELTKEEKDQCLLASKNCASEVDSIQKRIKKLNAEIDKGTRVYSAEELQKLEQKLKEVKQILDTLEKPGRGK